MKSPGSNTGITPKKALPNGSRLEILMLLKRKKPRLKRKQMLLLRKTPRLKNPRKMLPRRRQNLKKRRRRLKRLLRRNPKKKTKQMMMVSQLSCRALLLPKSIA